MTIGIYKIENQVNGKVYIGQSVHIEKRWGEHKNSTKSLISQSFKKYGLENFEFSILEECEVNILDELENYYIKKYNSLVPNGYNIYIDNGETTHTHYVWNDKTLIDNIIKDLKLDIKSISEIAEEYEVTIRTVYRINSGENHFQTDYTYPIRAYLIRQEPKYCELCHKPITSGAKKYCVECSSIAQRKVERPNSETLIKEVYELGFEGTGRQYKVTGNTIKKWCKYYDLPYKIKELKLLYEELNGIETPQKIKKELLDHYNTLVIMEDKDSNQLEFNSINDAALYLQSKNLTTASLPDIRSGIGKVLKQQRKTYLKYNFYFKK